MEPDAIRDVLTRLLDDSGAAWTSAAGHICFRLAKDGAAWQVACRCIPGRLLVYSRWPFAVEDAEDARRQCCEINAQLVQGAVYLPPDGQPVCRTDAALPDAYDAALHIREAIEYNAAAVCRFWQKFLPGPTL